MPCAFYFISQRRKAAAELHACHWVGCREVPFEERVRFLHGHDLSGYMPLCTEVTADDVERLWAAREWEPGESVPYGEWVARLVEWMRQEGPCWVQTEHDEPGGRFWSRFFREDKWEVYCAVRDLTERMEAP